MPVLDAGRDGRRRDRPRRRSRIRRPAQPRALDRRSAAAGVRRGDDEPRPRGRADADRAGVRRGRGLRPGAELRLLGVLDRRPRPGARRRRADGAASTPRPALLGNLDWQRTSSPAELATLAGPARARARGRRARHRRADGLRAALGSGGVPRGGAARRRAPARRRSPTCASSSRSTRRRRSTARARSRSRPPRPVRRCTTATSTARRAPRRPGARRPSTDARAAGSRVTVEAYPYGMGSTSIGAFFLAPERLRRRRADAVEHRDARHRRADRRRAPARRDPRSRPRRDLLRGVPRRARRGGPRAAAARARLPRLDRRQRRDAGGVARPAAPTPGSGRCRRAHPRTRARRGRSPAACG